MRISDWSSDVCSSDLRSFACVCRSHMNLLGHSQREHRRAGRLRRITGTVLDLDGCRGPATLQRVGELPDLAAHGHCQAVERSEERRVGTEVVSPCRFRWSPYLSKKNKKNPIHV